MVALRLVKWLRRDHLNHPSSGSRTIDYPTISINLGLSDWAQTLLHAVLTNSINPGLYGWETHLSACYSSDSVQVSARLNQICVLQQHTLLVKGPDFSDSSSRSKWLG